VNECLDFIAEARTGPDMQVKLSFFQETRHAFGRSALVLSGGGALGAFHLVRISQCWPAAWQQCERQLAQTTHANVVCLSIMAAPT
jgi:hypothetical protein